MDKKEISSKILQSKIFLKAPKSSALLRYLVQADLEGSYLKENIIDIEFFGGNLEADKTNARVRVNVYNLRKKLEVYYASQGKEDTWRLIIDKGQYGIRYVKVSSLKKNTKSISFWQVLPYLGLLLVLLSFFVNNSLLNAPKVWRDYFKNDFKTTMFIGDAYSLYGRTITGGVGVTRDFKINNATEYYDFIEINKKYKDLLKPSPYSYITGMGAYAANNISRVFSKYTKSFTIRFASKTTYDDLKEGNIIYVGPFHRRQKFTTLFNNENRHFKISDTTLQMVNIPNKKDSVIHLTNTPPDMEYAIVSRSKSLNAKEQFLFFSNHDIGVLATVEFFSNKDSLAVFTSKYLKNKDNFTAVYKVFGKDRTNMKKETICVVPF
ncbi:hypothetical protein CLV91_2003 [Maribacter vaceletii]|uniref:Uncharacterized protein n=1 Tax=Maribacter vaceletii TaxID=1206816 RepID=A0A495E902_9FLAO|nr:helix-turn-helix domain-containing protein [Maribacter vaceletii]RKR13286.1 hypothetical protein CLV91_2003 [Maribacter vaceletii]